MSEGKEMQRTSLDKAVDELWCAFDTVRSGKDLETAQDYIIDAIDYFQSIQSLAPEIRVFAITGVVQPDGFIGGKRH